MIVYNGLRSSTIRDTVNICYKSNRSGRNNASGTRGSSPIVWLKIAMPLDSVVSEIDVVHDAQIPTTIVVSGRLKRHAKSYSM
jgi:hypothetical protein